MGENQVEKGQELEIGLNGLLLETGLAGILEEVLLEFPHLRVELSHLPKRRLSIGADLLQICLERAYKSGRKDSITVSFQTATESELYRARREADLLAILHVAGVPRELVSDEIVKATYDKYDEESRTISAAIPPGYSGSGS